MKSLVPTARSYPFAIIPILSASTSASSRWWVVRTMVLSSVLTYSKISQMALLDIASIPEVGSSKNTTLEPPIRAIQRESFLLLPLRAVWRACNDGLGFWSFLWLFLSLVFFFFGDSLDFRDEVEVFFEGHVFVEYFLYISKIFYIFLYYIIL